MLLFNFCSFSGCSESCACSVDHVGKENIYLLFFVKVLQLRDKLNREIPAKNMLLSCLLSFLEGLANAALVCMLASSFKHIF